MNRRYLALPTAYNRATFIGQLSLIFLQAHKKSLVRVSLLVAGLRKELFRHHYSFHRKLGRHNCAVCQIDVGQEVEFPNYHMLTEGVEKRVRALARTPYGPAVNGLLRVIRKEWQRHTLASSIDRAAN
jgi:hypothetical protein